MGENVDITRKSAKGTAMLEYVFDEKLIGKYFETDSKTVFEHLLPEEVSLIDGGNAPKHEYIFAVKSKQTDYDGLRFIIKPTRDKNNTFIVYFEIIEYKDYKGKTLLQKAKEIEASNLDAKVEAVQAKIRNINFNTVMSPEDKQKQLALLDDEKNKYNKDYGNIGKNLTVFDLLEKHGESYIPFTNRREDGFTCKKYETIAKEFNFLLYQNLYTYILRGEIKGGSRLDKKRARYLCRLNDIRKSINLKSPITRFFTKYIHLWISTPILKTIYMVL